MGLWFIIGTRPEAIKLAPVILEARKRGVSNKVFCTGQHKTMVKEVLNSFEIEPDHFVDISDGDNHLSMLTIKIISTLDFIFKTQPQKPDFVVVQGDTISAFVAALVSFYYNISVAHVEAGLRSNNKYSPFPEEMMRLLISKIADYHFCPTVKNMSTLLREGISAEKCFLTGNTGIDAVSLVVEQGHVFKNPLIESAVKNYDKIVLMTMHRRENWEILPDVFAAVKEVLIDYEDVGLILPAHPNPHILKHAHNVFSDVKNAFLVYPLPYKDFIAVLSHSNLVITDSGGLQEEAPFFGIPVIVVRRETERVEGVLSSHATLIGINPVHVKSAMKHFLFAAEENLKDGKYIYGKGDASKTIMDILTGRV